MEFIIPALALGGLYTISKQKNTENFDKQSSLPNVDVPNRNYPDEYPIQNAETELTSKLSTVNHFESPGVYTDKYYNPALNLEKVLPPLDDPIYNAEYRSMTGEIVDLDYFRHNNMVPFFKKNYKPGTPQAHESTLDNYTGAGSSHIAKVEQSPLFSPSENHQWPLGMPSTTDFVQSRMNPSMKMTNVTPFESIKVAPGLGLGYTSEGMGGFNSGMLVREQWQDRNVDELRVANKPKASGLSMLGFEGPANSHIKAVPHQDNIGIMEKNRVERTFEMGHDRLFTTTGITKGTVLYGLPVDRPAENRPETSISYSGVAGTGKTMQQVRGEYMPSHNQELGAVPFTAAYAANHGNAHDADYGAKSVTAYPNNRSLPRNTDENAYYGAVKNTLTAAVAPFMDMLRPSRKENTVGNLRPYQNAKAPVQRSYAFNPNDTAPVTHRQTMEVDKMHWNINANQRGGAYETTQVELPTNQRDTTNVYYAGNASAGNGTREARNYDAEYRQRNNDIKSSTIQGRMVKGNMSLLNGDINMRGKAQETMLLNQRPVAGAIPIGLPPSIEHFGDLQNSNTMNLYSGQQLDRNNGDILSQLKGNPYTLSVVKAF
jgi:hypothetical protein